MERPTDEAPATKGDIRGLRTSMEEGFASVARHQGHTNKKIDDLTDAIRELLSSVPRGKPRRGLSGKGPG